MTKEEFLREWTAIDWSNVGPGQYPRFRDAMARDLDALLAEARRDAFAEIAAIPNGWKRAVRDRVVREDCKSPGAVKAGFHLGWDGFKREVMRRALGAAKEGGGDHE